MKDFKETQKNKTQMSKGAGGELTDKVISD